MTSTTEVGEHHRNTHVQENANRSLLIYFFSIRAGFAQFQGAPCCLFCVSRSACHCLLCSCESGRAYRQCDVSGNWELVPSNNRTWTNYTECTRYLTSNHRNLEEVCTRTFSVWLLSMYPFVPSYKDGNIVSKPQQQHRY